MHNVYQLLLSQYNIRASIVRHVKQKAGIEHLLYYLRQPHLQVPQGMPPQLHPRDSFHLLMEMSRAVVEHPLGRV